MNKFLKLLKSKFYEIISPQPEIDQDYVDKVVYLLRKNFTTEQQNQILISIGHNLSKLREEDMKRIEREYAILEENTLSLKLRMAIS